MYKTLAFPLFASILIMACGHGDDGNTGGNEGEVITTAELTFSPTGGGAATIAVFDDPDGDGGEAPTVDEVTLQAGMYTLTVRFENRLENPAEDITVEVADESQEHQVFLTGSAVDGPASDNPGALLLHSYDDQDVNGLPIGLRNAVVASAGSGELVVTLRHLPPVGGAMVKSAELSSEVRDGGFSAIGGSTDAQVSFAVTIQ